MKLYLVPGVLNVVQDEEGNVWHRCWVKQPGATGAIRDHVLVWRKAEGPGTA